MRMTRLHATTHVWRVLECQRRREPRGRRVEHEKSATCRKPAAARAGRRGGGRGGASGREWSAQGKEPEKPGQKWHEGQREKHQSQWRKRWRDEQKQQKKRRPRLYHRAAIVTKLALIPRDHGTVYQVKSELVIFSLWRRCEESTLRLTP